jgi:hypothetical protein
MAFREKAKKPLKKEKIGRRISNEEALEIIKKNPIGETSWQQAKRGFEVLTDGSF